MRYVTPFCSNNSNWLELIENFILVHRCFLCVPKLINESNLNICSFGDTIWASARRTTIQLKNIRLISTTNLCCGKAERDVRKAEQKVRWRKSFIHNLPKTFFFSIRKARVSKKKSRKHLDMHRFGEI